VPATLCLLVPTSTTAAATGRVRHNTAFSDPDERKRVMSMMSSVTPTRWRRRSMFFDYLSSRPEVSGTTFGTTGTAWRRTLCGGPRARPVRGMSFHARLASDDPAAHTCWPTRFGPVYVGGARTMRLHPRGSRDAGQGADAADVEHTIEWYAAAHVSRFGPPRRL